MELTAAINELMEYQSRLSAYNHATGILYFDGTTGAPLRTAENRAHTTAILTEEIYRISTSEKTEEMLSYLKEHVSSLSVKEARMVELLSHNMNEMKKIPEKEYIAYQELLVKADAIWHEAKDQSDFPMFEPYLAEIFETNRRFAGYCAPGKNPFDYWLSEYEPGITTDVCDGFFSVLREHLVPLIQKIGEAEQVDDSCLTGFFSEPLQKEFSFYLMELLGLDLEHVGFATTEHPYTTNLGSHLDERITTHFMEDRVDSSMYSVIHESGHALYDTGSSDDLCYTVLDTGLPMSMHESQSRLYENIFGRSFAFCEYVIPELKKLWPENFSDITPELLYRAVNKVQPSLVRTEADEVTYCMHVMVRYELEKAVMAGELSVHDLPGEWNRMYREYLGVTVPDDRHGVLQDSHWSGGLIGYFQSYALGSAYGPQYLAAMEKEFPVSEMIGKGDFSKINRWLREHIWQYGQTYLPEVILQNTIGEFDPLCYTGYLEHKYSDIYGII